MDAFSRNQNAAKEAFSGNVFADLAKRNMAMFEGASRAFNPLKKDATAKQENANSELDQLRAELAELQAKVDRLSR
jgi:polyhydroxyalkanoate synthesis regulator protein